MTDLIIVIEYTAISFCIRIVQDLFTRTDGPGLFYRPSVRGEEKGILAWYNKNVLGVLIRLLKDVEALVFKHVAIPWF